MFLNAVFNVTVSKIFLLLGRQHRIMQLALRLASFCMAEEERESGTHCLCMCQAALVTCILLKMLH